MSNHSTTCPLDPVPSSLLQAISNDILPSLTTLSNSSLNSGHIQTSFKSARFQPLLKKPVLDNTAIKN